MKTRTEVKVIAAVTNKNGDVLLIKEKYPKQKYPRWNLIRGTYGDVNENVFDAAKREALEEASIKIKTQSIAGIYVLKVGPKVRVYLAIYATAPSSKATPQPKKFQKKLNETILETRWFSKMEIRKLKRSKFIASVVYEILQDWLKGKKYSSKIIKQIK